MGIYRLILALMVALSHAPLMLGPLNEGAVAVTCFYLISGYTMTGLLRRHYTRPRDALRFYAERFFRLWPPYLLVAGLTLVWVVWAKPVGYAQLQLIDRPELHHILSNILIWPITFYMFTDLSQFALIGPAWSLGLEISFYLLAPFIIFPRVRLVLIGFSLAVAFFAAMNIIKTDWYGYRLLPGVLFIFLLGSCMQDLLREGNKRGAALLSAGVMLAIPPFFMLCSQLDVDYLYYTKEILLGLLIGMPTLFLLSQRKSSRFDNWCGDLSYGVFLCHVLVKFLLFGHIVPVDMIIAYLAATLLTAAAIYQVAERPLLRLRRSMRPAADGLRAPAGRDT